jgi:hypothetical protein
MSRASDLAQIDPRAARMIASVRSGIRALLVWPAVLAFKVVLLVGILVLVMVAAGVGLSDPSIMRLLAGAAGIFILAVCVGLVWGLRTLLAVPRELENMAIEDLWKKRDKAQDPAPPVRQD